MAPDLSTTALSAAEETTADAPVWSHKPEPTHVGAAEFRMYAQRPHHLREVLSLAQRWSTRTYVVQQDRVVTYADLYEQAQRRATVFANAGVAAQDRILILGWNSPDWILNFWACQALGAVPVLANAWWSDVEIADAITLVAPAAVLADEASSPRLPQEIPQLPWAAIDNAGAQGRRSLSRTYGRGEESEAAVIIFTSGTSGRPKAVELSHRAVLANLQMLLQVTRRLPHQITQPAGEVALHTGPLFHVGGPQMLGRTIALGNTIVLPSGRFDPADVLELIERHRVTRWSAVPTMATRVLDHPDLKRRDVSSLTALTIGGAPIHADLLARIGSELPSVKAGVPTGYGLTENGGQATAASGRDTLIHPGSAGFPLPCAEVGFKAHPDLPDAEVLLRSPTQMTRYIGIDESPIDEQGWLHTGDLGRLDDEGRLWITGRAKDLIIRGGENIAPAAIEGALLSLPDVVEAAVVGVPHPDLGEEVCAFVVTTADGPTAHDLSTQLRGQIASFAVPTVWHLRTEPLPTNQTGKIDKPALASYARTAARPEAS
jgi:acyl-CoA synthetase (AMP-forming)/AMP-acid ligase II